MNKEEMTWGEKCNELHNIDVWYNQERKKIMLQMEPIEVERKKKIRDVFSMDDWIVYQLNNYGAFYTGEYNHWHIECLVKNMFPEATCEDIRRVYFANKV